LKLVSYLLIFTFISACDLSSQLHKEILETQKDITEQRYSRAVIRYKNILHKSPPRRVKIKIYYHLGEIYSSYLGQFDKSYEYYKKIIQESEDPLWKIKAQEKVAELEFNFLKDFSKAIESYRNLVNITPPLKQQDYFEYQMIRSYIEGGNFDQAIVEIKKVMRKKNHEYRTEFYYLLGKVYFLKKDWKNAIVHWKNHIKIETDKDKIVRTKFLMANAYETMEKLKEAYQLYYSILPQYPNPELIKNRLNSLYERRIARKR